jgi:enoyl-CoA hydratase/carnithine racemase
MDESGPGVLVERHDTVTLIRLNRPRVHNALDPATLAHLIDVVERACADPQVGALVLTGGRTAFTTGEDLTGALHLTQEAFAAQIADFQRLATLLRHAPKPVVAAVGGFAYGGGLEIAVNCDARIAADNARFACPEVRWSLTITNGSSALLRELVGDGWTRELVLFGAVLDAERALQIGLVTRVVDVDSLENEALAMAASAAQGSPKAVRLSKELLNAGPRQWQETLDAETAAVLTAFAEPQARERLADFARRGRR